MSNLKQARDKMSQYGLNAMSDLELLTATKYKGTLDEFYRSFEYKAAKELVRRRETPEKQKIKSSLDTYKHLSFLNDEDEESFYMVTVNRAQYVINTVFLAKGHDYGVVVGIKQIVLQAINDKACGVILCHNHPSGNQNPSQQDISLTKSVKEALKMFDIPLLEHIIIARDNNYYSMADEGIL
jgi:DNA repair protein RadC